MRPESHAERLSVRLNLKWEGRIGRHPSAARQNFPAICQVMFGDHGFEIPGNPSTVPPNCRTSALSEERPMATSRAPGADFGLWRTATADNTHRTELFVRLSGEIQAGANKGVTYEIPNHHRRDELLDGNRQ